MTDKPTPIAELARYFTATPTAAQAVRAGTRPGETQAQTIARQDERRARILAQLATKTR